jgi:hypothetical protein
LSLGISQALQESPLKIPLTQNGGRLDTTEAESPSLISETPKSADVLRANIGMYNPLRKDINS